MKEPFPVWTFLKWEPVAVRLEAKDSEHDAQGIHH